MPGGTPVLRCDPESRLVLRINELYHDLEGVHYQERHRQWQLSERAGFCDLARPHFLRKAPVHCLDYGSGAGFASLAVAPLLEKSDRLTCVDLSQALLDVCRENLHRAGIRSSAVFLKSNGTQIPVADSTVDIVMANSVLHHLPRPERFGSEVARVLKPGGVVIVSHEPNGDRQELERQRVANALRLALRPARLVHRAVEASPILERWLRALLGSLSASFRQRNQMLDEISRVLVQEGLVDRPLRGVEIQQLVDVQFRCGFRKEQVTEELFEGFEVVSWTSFQPLGEVTEQNRLTRALGRWLHRRSPRAGFQLAFVLRKPGS